MFREDVVVGKLAERQHGVFRRDQAFRAGLSRDAIMRRLKAGAWIREYHGVYRLVGSILPWEGRALAACWAGGPGGAASHRCAARFWDLPGGRDGVIEVVCARWRRKQHEGLIVHETVVLDRWDIRTVDGVPVTSPERTLLDLGGVVSPTLLEMAVDGAIRHRLVTRATLRTVLARLGRSGRNGAGVLRQVLDLQPTKGGARESPMETRLLQVLRRCGLPDPTPQYEVYDRGLFIARVDAAYPQWRIAIEYESIEHHAGSSALVRDSARRNRLIAARWQPITATVADIRAGGAALATAIRAAAHSSGVRNGARSAPF